MTTGPGWRGKTGLTVTPGDVDGLAAALALLIGDPALREEMGARGRVVAVRNYDESAVIASLRTRATPPAGLHVTR